MRRRKWRNAREERNTARYRGWRTRFLIANPLCAECARQGRTVEALEMDHIVPVFRASDRFWDETNVQGLCYNCHMSKTAKENRRTETVEEREWREYTAED